MLPTSDWTSISIEDIEYLVSFSILRAPLGYHLMITDLEQVWESSLQGKKLIHYKRKTMPQLTTDESELVDTLKRQIYNTDDYKFPESHSQPHYSLSNSKTRASVILTLESKIGFFPFSWPFHCQRVDSCKSFIKNNFVLPLFVVQQELVRRTTCLEQILYDKDRQIQEYKKLGLKIPKSLQVPLFDKKTFENDAITSSAFTANLNRPLKRFRAPTTDIITAYHQFIQPTNIQPQESDSDEVFDNKHDTLTKTKSLNTDMGSYQGGVGLFSLELHDEQSKPSTTKLKSSSTQKPNDLSPPQESPEELERRKQIKDKLKKEKEKREQEKQQKKRKFV